MRGFVSLIVKNLYAGQGKPLSGGLADTGFGYNPELEPDPYDPESTSRSTRAAARRC